MNTKFAHNVITTRNENIQGNTHLLIIKSLLYYDLCI